MRIWDVSELVASRWTQVTQAKTQVRYTNAKVLLVGDSGVGKTGLTHRLAGNYFSETISTDGAWATHCSLPHAARTDGIDREIWLWDFAGQVDYRLVHQLFMDDAAAAVLLFNPQHENPFEGLGQWDRDLQKAARKPFVKLLAAGRTDRGGLIVSDASITRFIQERGFLPPLHLTSALTGEGCEPLRDAIVNSIDWQNIPTTNSPALYKRLKEEILHLRDSNLILIRLAELKQRMNLALAGENFELQELNTVLTLLNGPGIVQRLGFGDFILLKPEVLSRYAAATIRKVRSHPDEMGYIFENDLLTGNLDYRDFVRLPAEDEEIILRALHETLIQRAWCIRQPSDSNTLLIFPSYFRRERPEQANHPNTLVTYRFTGPADDIYATLVVRLNHTTAFAADQLWNFAADFKNQTGKSMGLKLIREPEGTYRLEVYFQPGVDENSQLIFLRYIHNHLTEHAQNVVRLRHYACENKKCDEYGQPFTDQMRVDKALARGGKGVIYCPSCGKPIQLHDLIEEKFESPKIIAKANKLAEESRQVIDNESRELILVGHAKAITGEAGQIFRETSNSDHGIDAEIEFKDGQGHATGQRLYLQLKSGDSYLKKRKRDGAEVFHVSKQRWIDYWQKQAYPVMLVIRTSNEEIRWMNVTEYLRQATEDGTKEVSQIDFKGERFDAISVRKWRDTIISSPL
jgi:small GTP-binding protein